MYIVRRYSNELKKNENLNWKNWDGRKVPSVSMKEVDHMLCEYWKDLNNIIPGKQFQIHPKKYYIHMSWKVNKTTVPQKIKGLTMIQFPINSNIVTTGYTLQG